MNQLTQILAKCLIEQMIAIEFGSELKTGEDFAIQILEQTGATLKSLSSEQKTEFQKILCDLSMDYNGENRKFIENLPENFGLNFSL